MARFAPGSKAIAMRATPRAGGTRSPTRPMRPIPGRLMRMAAITAQRPTSMRTRRAHRSFTWSGGSASGSTRSSPTARGRLQGCGRCRSTYRRCCRQLRPAGRSTSLRARRTSSRSSAAGYAATTNAGGAGKWREEFADYFEGAQVVVIADKDERGEAHARSVRRSLLKTASEVSIVKARTGKDATDHLEAGHAIDEFVAVPPRFEQIRLGTYEPVPAEWLAEPVLIERAYTVITSKPGKGKTALALCLSIPLIERGRTVVLLDQENGPEHDRD